MGITVLSPYNGEPVKIRDQDVGRAVRDRESRIFYVLPKSDGSGYYGAPTRAGGERDEQRYLELEAKVARTGEIARENVLVHDARGPGRNGRRGRLVVLILFIMVLLLVYLGYKYRGRWQAPPAEPVPMNVPAPSSSLQLQEKLADETLHDLIDALAAADLRFAVVLQA